jgi:hypothetical protein
MRAVIKGISNDILDVEKYYPENVDNFSLSFRIQIGFGCAPGGDDFELLICTPKWLEDSLWDAR